MDLAIAGRIERLNQPTLLAEFAGSPLSKIPGTPAAFFAGAADFLSERLIFLNVGGTFRRPQIRPDAAKQVQAETIRYFLRTDQFLPQATQPTD